MKENKIKKMLSIVLTIIIILTIAGISLAYFLANVEGNGKSLTSTSGELSINYLDEREIQADNLAPRWSEEKTITVTNTGDDEVNYNLYWSCVENELTRTQDLTYTITEEEGNELKNTTFPTETEEKTIIPQTINKGETKTYTVKIEYARSNEDQSIDMGKIFRGIINVQPEGAGQKNECPSESYTVQIEPSEMVDVSTKEVSAGENATFTYTGTLRNPKITCTNNQSGKIEGNIITINKVTNNTTCSISSKHTVQIKVENGTTAEEEKEVNTGEETTFTATPNTGYSNPTVSCTNNQKGTIQNNTVTVSNITNDTTCTVTYKPITYTITYNLGGGSVTGNPSTYTIETNTITLKNPTKRGYTFTGWTGSNGTTAQATVTIPKGSTGNKTYTANYKINTYTVNATVLNGTIEGETSKKVNYKGNTTFTLNPTEGYGNPEVTCTNSQVGSMNDNTLTVNNVTNDTTCTVEYKLLPLASEYIIAKAEEGNAEGLIKIDQPETGQTEAQTEYRYSGSDDTVKNYVNFNNETWRIIGVFPTDDGTGKIENRVKIIIEEGKRIKNYSWDTGASTMNRGYGINQWGESGDYEGADLMRLLNPGYESESVNNSLYWNRGSGTCYDNYNNGTTTCDFSSTGLTENAKEMIEDAVWYTSASNYDITASESYAEERASTTTDFSSEDGVTRTTNWTGKVGLMYPSDYGYASSGCRNGEQTLYNYDNETCRSTNWLFFWDNHWLLSPSAEERHRVRHVYSHGIVSHYNAAYTNSARPAIYLSSSVKITGGDGTLYNPYELSL